jgi:Co/Zn/Cd efflux system component
MIVALLNLGYFFVEFVMARRLGSVSLFADSVDFLEDAAINFMVFFALVWSARTRARVGHVLAVIIVVPAVATLWTAIVKIANPTPPEVLPLTLTALGALAINLVCAGLLVRHRGAQNSLVRGAWLAARNDSFANLLVLAAALVTLGWYSGWPDIVAGLIIGALNADAAVKVWKLASLERLAAR